MNTRTDHEPQPIIERADGWLSRERSLALVLVIATGVTGYLCYRLIVPFLPSLAWALALAVIAHPLHRWMRSRIANANLAAALAVAAVAVVVVAPAIFVTHRVAIEASVATNRAQEVLSSGNWQGWFESHPRMRPVKAWIESQLGLSTPTLDESQDSRTQVSEPGSAEKTSAQEAAPVERAAALISRGIGSLIGGTGWLFMQLLVTFMTLFYFFRDRYGSLKAVRSLLPLTRPETDEVFSRVDDTIHATIYGSVVVAMVQ